MVDGDQVHDLMIPLIRNDVRKMILDHVKKLYSRDPVRMFQKVPSLPSFGRASLVKKVISPLLMHSFEASEIEEVDEEYESSSLESEESFTEEEEEESSSQAFMTPKLPEKTVSKTFDKILDDQYKRARAKLKKRIKHEDLHFYSTQQVKALFPYLLSKAKKDLPKKLHEHWMKTSKTKQNRNNIETAGTSGSNLHQEIERFINETLTPITALQFARSSNVKFLFVMPLMNSNEERSPEKETINVRIGKDATLLCAYRYVMLNEKKYDKEVIVANLKKAVRKILRNIHLIKTHFEPGESKFK
jgi:hypothetical protein